MDWDSIKHKLKLDVNLKNDIIFWVLFIYILVYALNSGLDMIPFLSIIPYVGQALKAIKLVGLALLVCILILSWFPHKSDCDACKRECTECKA